MLDVKSGNSNNVRYRAYCFSLAIIKLVKDFPSSRVYSIFTDQLLRAATSVGANLIEARSSNSKRDFARFYQIALKSSSETEYWLCLLRDGKLADETNLSNLIIEIDEISKMIGASLLTLRKPRD